MLSDGKYGLCDLMMVNETKAKARVRALREVPSYTDLIYTPFTITQHICSFILPRKCPSRVACGVG